MSVATLLSRATGFIRMWATAFALGTGAIASAYNVANNIPNMIFELVAGGILSSLFIPTFTEIQDREGEAAAWKFASQIFNLSLLALGAVAIVGTILPEPFVWTQTFKMDSAQAEGVRATAEFFFRFFAIQVVIYGVGMVIQGILNSQRKYLWTALGPVFNNIIVIATLIFVATQPLNTSTLSVLAIGTTLGVVGMFAVMVPSLTKLNFKYSFSLGLKNPYIINMFKLGIPTLVYVITNLVTVSFRNASALAVTPRGPSILMYAWTWYQLPYGILAVALATALFTELSSYSAKGDFKNFKSSLSSGLRSTAVLIIPASALLYVLAEPLTTLYLAGRFNLEDIPRVANILRVWAINLSFFATMMFTLRAFYSLKDTKTPATVNVFTSLIQIAGYTILTGGILGWKGLGLKGIPYADLIFCFVTLSVLLYLMRKKIGSFDLMSFISVSARMLAASAIAAVAVHYFVIYTQKYFMNMQGALLQIAVGTVLGLIIAFGLASLFKVKEVVVATELVHKVLVRLGAKRNGKKNAKAKLKEAENNRLKGEESKDSKQKEGQDD